jgi:hypothetical protein
MARDSQIEAIFTTADDAMQGLWALHMYLKAATDTTDEQSIGRSLPEKVFQLTHEWFRSYDPKELVRAIRDTGIDFLLSRASLVSLVVISEAAVGGMNARLAKLHHSSEVEGNKRLLQWAFGLLRDSTSGSENMLRRLPETCGDLDNARRLRNCIVHNNGKYSNRYSEDAIDDGWVVVQREPDTSSAAAGRHAIQLTTSRYEHFSRSHIEFLHILHNTIQSRFFGHHDGYTYAEEGKQIEWHRVLTGREGVGL